MYSFNNIFLLIICIVFVFILIYAFSNVSDLGVLCMKASKLQIEEHEMKVIYQFNADYCVFVGDIRGDLMSLYIALDKYKSFKILYPTAHIVFLGDYTGGGDYNVKCLETIIKLKLKDPLYVHLCRGNHETIDNSEDNSVFPELMSMYGEQKAKQIYECVGHFYASLSPIIVINKNILCCHGMIPANVDYETMFKYTAGILGDDKLIDIVWSNYPTPIAEKRPYGHNVSPKELFERCYALHITKVIKAHDYSGSGNRLTGSNIEVNIITSSIKKGKETIFCKYNDKGEPTSEERPDSHNVSKYILCLFLKNNNITYSPYLEYEDKIYIRSLGFDS